MCKIVLQVTYVVAISSYSDDFINSPTTHPKNASTLNAKLGGAIDADISSRLLSHKLKYYLETKVLKQYSEKLKAVKVSFLKFENTSREIEYIVSYDCKERDYVSFYDSQMCKDIEAEYKKYFENDLANNPLAIIRTQKILIPLLT